MDASPALSVILAVRLGNPSAHRILIAFTAWSSFARALVMGTMAFQFANQRAGFLWSSVVLAVIGVALIVLAPAGSRPGPRIRSGWSSRRAT